MNDIVTIICYGQVVHKNRSEAIDFYTDGIFGSEGSERDRYVSIVQGLRAGKKLVDDNWEWCE